MTLGIPLILLAIGAAFDLQRREIPNWVPLSIFVWALVTTGVGTGSHDWLTLAGGLALGCVGGGALFALARFGGGDAKMIAALGAVLGAKALLFFLYYAALAGGVLAVVALARRNREFAFGPAIALGYAALLAVSRGNL